MKAFYSLTASGRWKFISLLSGILVMLILTGLFEDYKLERIHQSFSSIYTDRLVPATDIYFISDHLYEKRLLMDDQFSRNTCQERDLTLTVNNLNRSIDSLLFEYEKTYFVNEESRHVQRLKEELSVYEETERRVIRLLEKGAFAEARQLFELKGRQEFHLIIQNLHSLARIQSTVGKELVKTSNADFASTHILSYFRVALAIIIGLIIFFFARASTVASKISHENYHLN